MFQSSEHHDTRLTFCESRGHMSPNCFPLPPHSFSDCKSQDPPHLLGLSKRMQMGFGHPHVSVPFSNPCISGLQTQHSMQSAIHPLSARLHPNVKSATAPMIGGTQVFVFVPFGARLLEHLSTCGWKVTSRVGERSVSEQSRSECVSALCTCDFSVC